MKKMKKVPTTILFLCLVLLGGLRRGGGKSPLPSAQNDPSAILVGAGDIADCTNLTGAEATARLLETIPGTVMAIGDLAYPDGTKENFQCYERT